jgi:hypothetical protein
MQIFKLINTFHEQAERGAFNGIGTSTTIEMSGTGPSLLFKDNPPIPSATLPPVKFLLSPGPQPEKVPFGFYVV